jgi:hypothetical protein
VKFVFAEGASSEAEEVKATSKSVPGPGAYDHKSQFKSLQKKAKTHGNTDKLSLMQNPPSIPSHNNVFGYD